VKSPRRPRPEAREEAKAKGAALKQKIESLAAELARQEQALEEKLLELPNLPHPLFRRKRRQRKPRGARRRRQAQFRLHAPAALGFGPALGILDFDRA